MITETIARFITEKSLADTSINARNQAKMAILDWFAAFLLGFTEDRTSVDPLLKLVTQLGGNPNTSIIGSTIKTSAPWAGLVNAYTGHLLDYDDTSPPVRSHLTTCVLPAVLAFGEEKDCSGEAILEAYLIGFEVALRMGEVMTPGWMRAGWHGTSIFGIFGAVAGCGKLAGLLLEQMRNALGIACSMSSGIAVNFGTMTKPLHAGHAVKDAILAVLLSKDGLSASEQAMEGFLHAYSWSDKPKYDFFQKLGNPWGLEKSGTINPKLYPCCHGLATTIEYGIIFKEKWKITADDIETIEIFAPPKALSAMHSRRYADTGEDLIWDYDGPPRRLLPGIPKTGKEAKFSKEYGFVTALLYGPPRIEDFRDEAVQRSDIQELMQKVKVYHDSELDKISYQYPEADWPYGERFVLKLKDGRTIQEEQLFVLGAARRPLSIGHVMKKFRECASISGLSSKRVDRVIKLIENLEDLDGISGLLRNLQLE